LPARSTGPVLAHPFTLAVTYGQFGKLELAGNALQELPANSPERRRHCPAGTRKMAQSRSCRTPDGRVCAGQGLDDRDGGERRRGWTYRAKAGL
jgi:hypothetical protein